MNRYLKRLRAVPHLVRALAIHGRPRRVLLFGPLSIGDDLLCTTVLREARRRGQPFAMMTNRPELFLHNPDPERLIPVNDYYAAALRRLGSRIVCPYYTARDDSNPRHDILPAHHIITEMCRIAGLRGEISVRPYFHLAAQELTEGSLFPDQVCIQSTCLNAALPQPTKEWGVERFVTVANELRKRFKVIQLGHADDPALPADRDLRGRTTLRQAAAILAKSQMFIGLQGFLAHLARAVDCPSVIVTGGRALPGVTGYACNENLYSAVPCAPCGLNDGCPWAMRCMTEILPETVVASALSLFERRLPRPLPAETAMLE